MYCIPDLEKKTSFRTSDMILKFLVLFIMISFFTQNSTLVEKICNDLSLFLKLRQNDFSKD